MPSASASAVVSSGSSSVVDTSATRSAPTAASAVSRPSARRSRLDRGAVDGRDELRSVALEHERCAHRRFDHAGEPGRVGGEQPVDVERRGELVAVDRHREERREVSGGERDLGRARGDGHRAGHGRLGKRVERMLEIRGIDDRCGGLDRQLDRIVAEDAGEDRGQAPSTSRRVPSDGGVVAHGRVRERHRGIDRCDVGRQRRSPRASVWSHSPSVLTSASRSLSPPTRTRTR